MSLRPSARTEVRRNRYKVAVDAEEGHDGGDPEEPPGGEPPQEAPRGPPVPAPLFLFPLLRCREEGTHPFPVQFILSARFDRRFGWGVYWCFSWMFFWFVKVLVEFTLVWGSVGSFFVGVLVRWL
jgi:hypothetical protein